MDQIVSIDFLAIFITDVCYYAMPPPKYFEPFYQQIEPYLTILTHFQVSCLMTSV